MGDISLQLASECLKNSSDVVSALPKSELSSDLKTITSVLKTLLEEEERRKKTSKRHESAKNEAFKRAFSIVDEYPQNAYP